MKLTKHCYELGAVFETLDIAIRANCFREIVYWVHECIESGFARECWDWLIAQPPQLYVGRDERDWQPAFCYTLALRMARPNSKMVIVVYHETAQAMFPEPPEPEMLDTSPRHYLRIWYEMYGYSIKTTTPLPLSTLGNWPELCADTPYWKDIFKQCMVYPQVALEDEMFSELFNYELEEQSQEIHKAYGYASTQ